MERQLPGYRLYFLDERGSILLRKDYEASGDHAALQIAHLAARMYSLTCSGFALWQGKRRVWEGSTGIAGTSTETAENFVLERQEVLQRSRWRLAASQLLLAERARLIQDRPKQEMG